MNTRRDFLKTSMALCAAPLFYPLLNEKFKNNYFNQDKEYLVEAKYYEKLPDKQIHCRLCPRECIIDNLERGHCGVRENRNGTYYTLVHSQACTYHIDPIEKKPLFHFLPSSEAFSFATVGCNIECKFCQNWQISQIRPEQTKSIFLRPADIALASRKNGCKSIAYTYTEPIIFYEYMYDTILAGKKEKIKSVMISNGYINSKPLKDLCKIIDGIKIDLKSFSEDFYKNYTGGNLKPVLKTIETIKNSNVWLEIVYLMIPTLNDKDNELKEMAKWIHTNLGYDVPIHFTRFHPQYKLQNLPSTPIETLTRAKQILDAEGMHYVYVGNVPGHPGENTYCPNCKTKVIERIGFDIKKINIKKSLCGNCGGYIPGTWD